jgi:hypothetical protein
MSNFIQKVVGYFYPTFNNEGFENQIISARKNKQYSEVVELVSQLNWKSKPFSSEIASCFLHSYYYMNGSDDDKSLELANLFLNHYGEVAEKNAFKLVKALIIETSANSEAKKQNFKRAIELYDSAFSWVDDSDYTGVIERIKESKNKTKKAWDDKLERELQAFQARVNFMSRSLTEFPELSDVVNLLAKHGIELVRHLSERNNAEIDKIKGISDAKMSIISSFKSNHNL